MIYRVDSNDSLSWAYYPEFERRVLAFAKDHETICDPQFVVGELRNRFINCPLFAGYWLILSNLPIEESIGHILAYYTQTLGKPLIFVLQLNVDSGRTFEHADKEVFATELREWMRELNAQRGKIAYHTCPVPVEHGQFLTPHDPGVWKRYLGAAFGFTSAVEGHVLKFKT